MQRLALFGSLTLVIGAITFANLQAPEAAGTCGRTKFKTVLVKEACAKGGQKAAKDAMKAFSKQHKIKNCKQCHETLAPSYDLKPDAYEQFAKLGGK